MDAETPNVDLPTTDKEVVPEKIEDEEIKVPLIHCELSDEELVHKIAQLFLPGLSTACVDNTSGDIFRTPGSIAAEIRKEMVEYITMRSETCVAESVILENPPDTEVSDHPYDIIADFVEDFTATKRNIFSRVSGWVLSEKREDKIDDFVQEMEVNGFWPLDRRQSLAQVLLKNVDFKSQFHCDIKFHSVEELGEHVHNCGFRSLTCTNESCIATFCAKHADQHDSICPFKIIPCEQKCPAFIMRREMDRHCITVCPMKLVNCPFYNLGCHSPVPYSLISQHCSESFDSHLLNILSSVHKEANDETLKHRRQQLVEAQSVDHLRGLQNLRLLTSKIREMDSKLGPLVVICPVVETEEAKDGSASETEEEKDKSNVTEEAKDASNATDEAKGGSNAAEGKEVVPNATEKTKDASIATEERKDAFIEIQERGVVSSATEVTKDGSKEAEDTKDGSKDTKDGSKEAEDTKDSSKEAEDTKDSSKEAEDTKDGSNEAEDTKDGSNKAEDEKDGSNEAEDAKDGSNETEDTKDGSKEAEDTKDVSKEAEDAKDVSKEAEDTKYGSNEAEDTKDGSNITEGTKDGSSEGSNKEEYTKGNGSNETEDTKDGTKASEEMMGASVATEEMNETSSVEQKTKNGLDSSDAEEKMKNDSDIKEEMKDGSDSSDAMAKVKKERNDSE